MAIEVINVVAAAVAGFILGMAVHSAWLHSRKRGEKLLNHIEPVENEE